ncbi:MAG: VWA domain-containing protein [Caldilineaceae bacterium]|nr:VWA domain-containing protein [Caldilineaceae bacterium]
MFPRLSFRHSLLGFLFVLGLILAISPFSGLAQGTPPIRPTVFPPIIEPPIGLPPLWTGVEVQLHSVEARIEGSVAAVHVTQRFRNPTQQTLEGTFVFPLPADAAIGDFQMMVDGQVLEGKLYKAEEARRIYEEIVRSQRDPALLEYLGQGLFQASVFPIPAGATRVVELTYRQVLSLEDGLYRFVVPLGRGSGQTPPTNMALSVDLRDQPGLRTIYSPSHNVSISREDDDRALIGFETGDAAEMRDFVLYFGTDDSAIGLDLLSYRPSREDGFFLLLAAPGLKAAGQEIIARDIVLVLDVSGSMQGEKIVQARDAARFVVENLNAEDRFNLISFSTGTEWWESGLQPVTAETRRAALRWIDRLLANGSTDINRALLEALGQLELSSAAAREERGRPAYVLFMTDGLPTQGEQNPDRIVANAEQNAPRDRTLRLFTFGVGYDVNTDLLDTVSRNLGGRSTYVRPEEAIDEAVSAFYAGISTPVLSDVSITVQGAQINDSYPYPLPDLFAGEQLVWAGRYKDGGAVTVILRGSVNGEERTFHYEDLSLVERGGESAVARLWATRKIGALLSEVRRSGANQEIIDAIVDLSLTYGIVTPYTSYLVLEPGMNVPGRAGAAAPELRVQPSSAPDVRSMRQSAEAAVAASVAEEAAADAVGMSAVESSIVRAELESAQTVQDRGGVRYLAGKSFVQQGWTTTAQGETVPLWVDTLYEETMSTRTLIFGSDLYFASAADRAVAQWLSLSPEMILVIDGAAIRVTTHEEGATTSPLATPIPAVEELESRGLWQRFTDFLDELFGW